MRVRHLTEIEIQALLDRRTLAVADSISSERYRKDLDSQEHLDNCEVCRAELEMYRDLYSELGRSATVELPRNFARKVTFSLPPFRARRTRARLQLAAVWVASLMISLFWLLGQFALSIPLTHLAASMTDVLRGAGLIKSVVFALTPSPSIGLAWVLPRAEEFLTSIERAFLTDISSVSLVMVAGLVVLAIVWFDSLHLATLRQKR